MARGSDYGRGGSTTSHTGIEMMGSGGGVDSKGKTTITKKYFVTNPAELDNAPVLSGFLATSISYNKINNTAYEQSVNYEAMTDGSGPGTTVWLNNGVKGTFEMFCAFAEKAIEKHPRIQKLKDEYFGYTSDNGSKILFPELYIPEGKAGPLANAGTKPNPMFGVTSYKEATLTLRHTYYTRTINAGIWNTVGLIVDRLPAGIPAPKGDLDEDGKEIPRQWMMQAPAVSKEGESWRVQHEYVMLDAKGSPELLYLPGTVPGT